MPDVEHADFYRGGSLYPPGWGVPAGERFSETRAAWVLTHVRAEVGASPYRQLDRAAARLHSIARLAELAARRTGP